MRVLKIILKNLILVITWLTLSPLWFYLVKRWKIKDLCDDSVARIAIMMISPLFIVLYFIIGVMLAFYVDDFSKKHYFNNKEKLEQISEVKLPKYIVTELNENEHFNSSYRLTFKFLSEPSDYMFDKIDKKIAAGSKDWSKSGNDSTFTTELGNGKPHPRSWDKNASQFIIFTITKGEKTGYLTFVEW